MVRPEWLEYLAVHDRGMENEIGRVRRKRYRRDSREDHHVKDRDSSQDHQASHTVGYNSGSCGTS